MEEETPIITLDSPGFSYWMKLNRDTAEGVVPALEEYSDWTRTVWLATAKYEALTGEPLALEDGPEKGRDWTGLSDHWKIDSPDQEDTRLRDELASMDPTEAANIRASVRDIVGLENWGGITLARDVVPESEDLGPNEVILSWCHIAYADYHLQAARKKFYAVMAKHGVLEVWGKLMAVIAKESEYLYES